MSEITRDNIDIWLAQLAQARKEGYDAGYAQASIDCEEAHARDSEPLAKSLSGR